jgi:hypothetical protein
MLRQNIDVGFGVEVEVVFTNAIKESRSRRFKPALSAIDYACA